MVEGTGPIVRVAAEMAMRGINGECSAELQLAASFHSPQLVRMLNKLNKHFDFINNPHAYGFNTSRITFGHVPFKGLCTEASNLCALRDLYAFLDLFHPSETNRIFVQQMMAGTTNFMNR